MTKLEKAKQIYIERKSRAKHPDGEFDSGGRWYPTAAEKCSCCDTIRKPSRSWPYSLMLHCRTASHIANLCNVSEKELRKAIRKEKAKG